MVNVNLYDDNMNKIPTYSPEEIDELTGAINATWTDGNPRKENRLYRFVTSANDGNEVQLANADSYVAGVSIAGEGADVKVQPMGVVTVQDSGTLKVGDKCMPSTNGIAVKSSNNLGYRVVGRVDSTHINIIVAPNNDMIQRIKRDMGDQVTYQLDGTTLTITTK